MLTLLNSCKDYDSGYLYLECDAPHNISYIIIERKNSDKSIPETNEDIKTIHIDRVRKTYIRTIYTPWPKYVKDFPDDTFTILIFHTDTVSHYTWNQIRQQNKLLVRYDIGADDYNKFPGTNKYKTNITIPYPPIPSMSSAHMCPPYEEVMAQYEEDCRKIAEREGE